MAASVLSVRVDAAVKDSFSELCDELGLTVSAAVNLFMRQSIREGGIPFKITTARMDAEFDSREASRVLGRPEIKAAVVAAARKVPAIEKVILFGSYARGEATPESDIDLRVVYEEGELSLIELSGFRIDINDATGKEVDVISKKNLASGTLAKAIDEEGVVLYER